MKDDILPGNIAIKAGTSVNYLIHAMGRDPDRWPQPTKFDPQRFVTRPASSLSM
jgi:cytochrome P450